MTGVFARAAGVVRCRGGTLPGRYAAGAARAGLLCVFFLASCATSSIPKEVALPTEIPPPVVLPAPESSGGIVDEIRSGTEKGTPSSLLSALDIIGARNLGATEFARVMVAVNSALLERVYPAVEGRPLSVDPPIAHRYSRILRDAERGVYTIPPEDSQDYLEHVLPFLAYYPAAGGHTVPGEQYRAALPHLEKAEQLNGESALAPYFLGVAYEQLGRPDDAFSRYSRVWNSYPECYPAALGLARLTRSRGQQEEAVGFLSDLALAFPGNPQVTRQLAVTYYLGWDWERAEAVITELLDGRHADREIALMAAHIMVEQGKLLEARDFLDAYPGINQSDPLYLFLRARIYAEAYQNKEAALNYLRTIMRNSTVSRPDAGPSHPGEEGAAPATPADAVEHDAAVYAVRLYMESPRPEERREGRELLARLFSVSAPSLDVVSLGLNDAIRREAWDEAAPYLARLLEERRSPEDLLAAYTMERALGNSGAALVYARELYRRDTASDEGIMAYASALIDTGRGNEAGEMIERRLNGMTGGALKSRYHYLRSLTRQSEETRVGDLNSGLFEDPRNLAIVIALFEIYHRRGEESRAAYYLRQALSLSPGNPLLRRYEAEYNAAHGAAVNGASAAF